MRRSEMRAVAGLGLATIVAYGAWFYAFGALIEPIDIATGWGVGFVSGVYGGAQLLGSILAVAGGRALDRIGVRRAVGAGGLIGGMAIAAASLGGPILFAAGYALGGALIGATGFYHVTLAAAARFATDRPERAVTAVTVLGAFAGPIFLPLTAVAAESLGWRPTVGILGLVACVGLTAAAVLTPSGGGAPESRELPAARTIIGNAWGDPPSRWKLIAAPIAALGYGILLVHHVPIMVAAGLPLTTAAAYAGARGFVQLGGRLALAPVVRRIGSAPAIVATYLFGAAGVLMLAGSASSVAAVTATLFAGLAIGAGPPLDAVYSAEVFDPASLGMLMGFQQLLSGAVMALGPMIAGVGFDITGSHATTVSLAAAGFVLGAVAIARVAATRKPRGRRPA